MQHGSIIVREEHEHTVSVCRSFTYLRRSPVTRTAYLLVLGFDERFITFEFFFQQAKHQELMAYNNELAALQSRLDRAENEAVKHEARLTHIHNTTASRTLLIGRIKMYVLPSNSVHVCMGGGRDDNDGIRLESIQSHGLRMFVLERPSYGKLTVMPRVSGRRYPAC